MGNAPATPPASISRVTTARSEARAAYDRLSRWYDLLAGGSEERYVRAGLGLLDIGAGQRVLEIGPGTGRALVDLARRAGPSGQVLGLDLSPGMLKIARARLQRAGMAGRAALCCGDATALPCAAGSVDAILMSFTLELFDTPDIPRVLAECRRVLRPGGRIAVVALSRARGATRAVRLYEWVHARFPRLADCRPILAGAALEAAGFGIDHAALASMWGLPVEIVAAVRPDGAGIEPTIPTDNATGDWERRHLAGPD